MNTAGYLSILLTTLCAVTLIACGDGPGDLVFDNPLSQGDANTSGQELVYTITDLGTFDGLGSYAYGINNKGQVVGYRDTLEREMRSFLWDPVSGMRDLGTPDGSGSRAHDINEAGQVVGYVDDRAFLWDNITGMRDLGTLGGLSSKALAINDSGQVVGDSSIPSSDPRAFLWANGAMEDLGDLNGPSGYRWSYVDDINNKGQIVGRSMTPDGHMHAFLWEEGVMTDLGTLYGGESSASGINEMGQVIGSAYSRDEGNPHPFHAFVWDNANGMKDLGALGGLSSYASSINNSGQIVGWSRTDSDELHAVLYSSDAIYDLNGLIDPNSGWLLRNARDINDTGQIVGDGSFNGENHAFLLTPLPILP